ncbi:amidohydrolase family protein [Streptomyces cyaneofuscatus]|uniref:amidohydrolase family protein n=1 Tax=Streptomyces cyaneofuscatus TaxID=66883 RepID=UPI002FEFC686
MVAAGTQRRRIDYGTCTCSRSGGHRRIGARSQQQRHHCRERPHHPARRLQRARRASRRRGTDDDARPDRRSRSPGPFEPDPAALLVSGKRRRDRGGHLATAGATLDAGFTTVRDTGGIDGGVVTAIAKGKVRGPRVLSCGPVQCQIGGHGYYGAEWEPTELWSSHHIPGLCALSMMAGNADELRRNVREAFRRGASFLKLCVTGGVVGAHDRLTDTQFTVEEIAAAVQEAAARNTYVTVHAHNNEGIRNAVEAGVRCVEHGTSLDEFTAVLMAAREVALVPTFAVVEQLLHDTAGAGLTESTRDRVEGVREQMTKALAVAKHAGARIGLGSDLIGPAQGRRGKELSLRAALETPMEAIVAATRTNAEILGLSGQVEVITPGAQADLTLWNGNPLEDPELFSDPNNAVLVIQAGQIVKDLR